MGTLENPVGTVLSPPYDAQLLIHCCNKDPKGIDLLSLCLSAFVIATLKSHGSTRLRIHMYNQPNECVL